MVEPTPAGMGRCPHGFFNLSRGCDVCAANHLKGDDNHFEEVSISGGIPRGMVIPESVLTTSETEHNTYQTGADAESMSWYTESQTMLEYAKNREISTIEDNKLATDDLGFISKLKKQMEARRKELLSPLKVQSDAIRDTYDNLMIPILEADKITRGLMSAFDMKQRAIRAEEERINQQRLDAAKAEMALKGELSEPLDLMEVSPELPKLTRTETASSGMRDNWKYEVVDILAVPREYLVIDHAMLNTIAKSHHDQKPVAGVLFYNEPIVAVRTK